MEYNKDFFELNIINLLLYENEILRKKINNKELTLNEIIFCDYLISPSMIIRSIIERKEKNEIRNKRKSK